MLADGRWIARQLAGGTGMSKRAQGLAAAAALLSAGPLGAAGFGIFEHGSKAMGMAGAFTAQADDPSALFHNAGGLAFQDERAFAAGATYITSSEAEFEGGLPFPGPSGRGEQKELAEVPPHVYWVQPIGEALRFGLGITSPFGLTTNWENPDNWPGRFLNTKASLRSIDLNPTLAFKLGDNFGLGIGAVARFSDVELNRRLAVQNPFTFRAVEAGAIHLESDFDEGFGWNAGLLHKWNNSFQWGLSYRSKVEVDYAGEGRITQRPTGNAQLDELLRTRLPFGQNLPIETAIEFPDMASLGLLFAVTSNLWIETDANWTGWSTVDQIVIQGTNPAAAAVFNAATSTIPQHWEDVYNYRLGVRWGGEERQWRFGYVFDETPQPDSAVSPLLPDADRNGFTVGYGRQGPRFSTDLALMYLPFDARETSTNHDGFNGTYNTTAWLFGLTFGF
jgi:long-chain fatty acid transport protein